MSNNSPDNLSEMQGCTLATIKRSQPCTAYQVRQIFKNSPSDFWSGSAGAIYPLLSKLENSKLIRARDNWVGRKQRKLYSLTKRGDLALKHWLLDVDKGAGLGFDPMRSRLYYAELFPEDSINDYIESVIERLQQIKAPEFANNQQQKIHQTWLKTREDTIRLIAKILSSSS